VIERTHAQPPDIDDRWPVRPLSAARLYTDFSGDSFARAQPVSPRQTSPSTSANRRAVVTDELLADHAPTVRRQAPGRGGSRQAILDAAGQLLVARGLVALSLDAVARLADVDTSLISRWWPSEEALALDVLRQEWLALAVRVHRRAARIGL
jgi:hypothetical protein